MTQSQKNPEAGEGQERYVGQRYPLEIIYYSKRNSALIPPEVVQWVQRSWEEGKPAPLPKGCSISFQKGARQTPTRTVLLQCDNLSYPSPIGDIPAVLHIGGLFLTRPSAPNQTAFHELVLTPPQRNTSITALLPQIGTIFIDPSGKITGGPSQSPSGGYWLEKARKKYENTQFINSILERSTQSNKARPPFVAPKEIALLAERPPSPQPPDRLLAILLSLEPKGQQSLNNFLLDFNPFREQSRGKINELYEKLGRAFGFLHFRAIAAHLQPHPGNVAILQLPSNELVVSLRDWESMVHLDQLNHKPLLRDTLEEELRRIITNLVLKPFLLAAGLYLPRSTSNPNTQLIEKGLSTVLNRLGQSLQHFAIGYTSITTQKHNLKITPQISSQLKIALQSEEVQSPLLHVLQLQLSERPEGLRLARAAIEDLLYSPAEEALKQPFVDFAHQMILSTELNATPEHRGELYVEEHLNQ